MTTIKFRRDTSANWTSVNPIPAQGEPCYETDTGKLKIGNGSDNYTTLPYVSDGGGSSGDLPIATATTLGGVKVGDNLSITEDGTLSASSEAKTVKTPNGHIKLDNAGLHNEDNSRVIINRNVDQREVRVGNGYEPTIIDGSSIKLNSTNITDRDGNTFLSGDTINGVKLSTDMYGNKSVANSGYTNNRLELTADACNLYDSDNRNVFGSSYDPGHSRTNWAFASQSNTVRIAGFGAGNAYGLMLNVPTDGTSPTIGYTYCGSDSSLFGKEQTFLRTEDVDNSTIKIVDGKLTASGGGSAPTNMVTTDTDQTISGSKTFTQGITATDITCGDTLTASNIRTTANGTIKLAHPMNNASGLITFSNDYGQLSISSSLGGNNNLLGVVRGTAYALINGDNITTRDKDGNERIYINTQNIDTTYMKWDSTNKKLKVDTAAVSGLGMPSDRYINLTVGVSGSTYTAPANGWFCCGGGPSTGAGLISFEANKGLYQQIHTSSKGEFLGLIRPVSKGDTLTINYRAMNNLFLRFTYAQGSENEV